MSHANAISLGYLGNGGDRMLIDGAPVPANPNDQNASFNVISPEYFSVMGIALIGGRAFTDADNEHGRDVAVISEGAAKKFWPNQNAVGRTFRLASEKDRRLEVVGVARDALFQLFSGGKSQPFFYIPYAQHSKGNTLMVFQLRTEQDPMALAPAVEKAVHDIEPQLPVFQVQSMRQGLYTMNGLLLFQIGASMATIMGGLGLTLAVIGLYGVISYTVGRRVHEIGLRMALGATRGTIFKMIYRQSIVIVGVGLGVGLAIALLTAKAVGGFVVVNVWDPETYIGVGFVLAAAAIWLRALPTRAPRYDRKDPMTALREN